MTEPAKQSVADLRKSAKLPAKQAGGATVQKFFELNKTAIQAVLPRHITADRVLRIGMGALRTNPKLKECTSESLFGAVLACAQLGLEPNTPMGHAYMVPFKNNQQNRMDVQVIFGYRGLIDLARRSGQIESISAHAVFQNDEFSYEYGLDEHCKHIPSDGNRGEITHFYAVAKFKGGGHAFEVMSRTKVEEIRDESKNYKFAKNKGSTVWGQHFEEMGRKTVIRRLYKYLPTSIEMAAADTGDGSIVTELPETRTAATDGALTGEFEVVEDEPGEDEPPVDSAGEVFDPQRHLDSGKRNKDGTFKKRPHRGKQQPAQQESSDPGGDPLAPHVEAMKSAANMDELNEAREQANGPDADWTDEQKSALDAFYKTMEGRLTAPPGDDEGGEGQFGGME